jgi:hypothetical protein
MKNFPSLLAVVGAWLCATGFILPGIIGFIIGSLYAIFIIKDTGWFTILFFSANVFAFFRLTL